MDVAAKKKAREERLQAKKEAIKAEQGELESAGEPAESQEEPPVEASTEAETPDNNNKN